MRLVLVSVCIISFYNYFFKKSLGIMHLFGRGRRELIMKLGLPTIEEEFLLLT